MKTIVSLKPFITFLFLVYLLVCLSVSSCIKDADDENPVIDSVVTDSMTVRTDSTFCATLQYVRGTWMGSYVGFDPQQKKISDIQRLVYFSPEGFYDSHVRGIVDTEDTITVYKEFEHEHGTYTLDEEQQIMSYTVEYDSLLDFPNDILLYFPGKILEGNRLVKSYEERLYFSFETDGRRDWIRTDANMLSPDDHQTTILYIMRHEQ